MSETVPDDRPTAPTTAEVQTFLHALALPLPADDDAGRVDWIASLERLKAAAGAAQARATAAFAASRQDTQEAAGVPRERVGRDVGAQLGLARHVSPYRGGRLVRLAEALASELPCTLAAMAAGECSEDRALMVARETAALNPDDRRAVDAALAPDLATLSDRELVAAARRQAYRLDPAEFVRRASQAEKDRYVSFRPAPDTMVQMSALLPLRDGIGVRKALEEAAASARADGDERSVAQLMADTLVGRITGLTTADAVSVEVQLVMTDQALLGESDEPARVQGHGPIPASVARRLLRDLPASAKAWVRRLYTAPGTGRLVAMESGRRCFDGLLRQLLILRDDICRTPYCGAPIKHADHVIRAKDGGATGEPDGQGLCEHCNYLKEFPGWRCTPDPDGGAGTAVTFTTPTGHTYTSVPPPLPHEPLPTTGPPATGPAEEGHPPVIRRWLHPLEIYYRPRTYEELLL